MIIQRSHYKRGDEMLDTDDGAIFGVVGHSQVTDGNSGRVIDKYRSFGKRSHSGA